MAVGTVGTIKRMKVVGSKTVPRLVTAPVTFGDDGDDNGLVTVNATDLEASKILGVLGATVWNGVAAVGYGISVVDPHVFAEAGVTTLVLQNVAESTSTVDITGLTATVLFECE
jgi:hypothetical protein